MNQLIQASRARLRAIFSFLRRIAAGQEGITIIELLTALAVIGVLAAMLMPYMRCQLDKARYASMMEDLRLARAAIEAFETDLGGWPCSLEEAFMGRQVPRSLSYCSDNVDPNNGHGNDWCDFFDESNPSGNNEHGGAPGVGYKLWSNWDFSSCTGVRFAWYTCCGEEPTMCTDPDSGKQGKGNAKHDSPECNLGSHPGNVEQKMLTSGACGAG
jgi:type II secretory pathway pseudopilin PulG